MSAGSYDRSGKHSAIQFIPGNQVFAGFRLVDPISTDEYGTVWRVIRPNGAMAVLHCIDTGHPEARSRLRSLSYMLPVRHPHILGFAGPWEHGGWIAVGTDLPDNTLRDQFDAARAAGRAGLELVDLIDLLRQAAQGIDYLNESRHLIDGGGAAPASLIHRAITPDHLYCFGSTLKLGGLNWVASLRSEAGDDPAAATGALPDGPISIYSAPELQLGQASTRSDQYSLAVAYCMLRGGTTPEFSSQPDQPVDLTMLADVERAAVARALAHDPAQRWPTCAAFVAALNSHARLIVSIPTRVALVTPKSHAVSPATIPVWMVPPEPQVVVEPIETPMLDFPIHDEIAVNHRSAPPAAIEIASPHATAPAPAAAPATASAPNTGFPVWAMEDRRSSPTTRSRRSRQWWALAVSGLASGLLALAVWWEMGEPMVEGPTGPIAIAAAPAKPTPAATIEPPTAGPSDPLPAAQPVFRIELPRTAQLARRPTASPGPVSVASDLPTSSPPAPASAIDPTPSPTTPAAEVAPSRPLPRWTLTPKPKPQPDTAPSPALVRTAEPVPGPQPASVPALAQAPARTPEQASPPALAPLIAANRERTPVPTRLVESAPRPGPPPSPSSAPVPALASSPPPIVMVEPKPAPSLPDRPIRPVVEVRAVARRMPEPPPTQPVRLIRPAEPLLTPGSLPPLVWTQPRARTSEALATPTPAFPLEPEPEPELILPGPSGAEVIAVVRVWTSGTIDRVQARVGAAWNAGQTWVRTHPLPAAGPAPAVVRVPAPPRVAPRTATIVVRMPVETAELVVRGAVGRGNPDEWYGPNRTIHSPPIKDAQDYLIGAFWTRPDQTPASRSTALRIEPGRRYEVDLRIDPPTAVEVSKPSAP